MEHLRFPSLLLLLLLPALVLLLSHRPGRAVSPDRDDFLKKAQEIGIINESQLLKLYQLAETMNFPPESITVDMKSDSGQDSDQHVLESTYSGSDERIGLFMHIYNHLTLLNVLYLSGAIVIMGAYTIFMTLALEQFNYILISAIMVLQVAVIGAVGANMWYCADYMYPGGILCTVSTSMVPFTVYHIQRAVKVWPKEDPGVFMGFNQWIRPGWVVMELATIVVGLLFYYNIHFPFLSFPVSFCLWYLSMDLAPLVPGWERMSPSVQVVIRARVSVAMGVGMMCSGYFAEMHLGSLLDHGFWLYFFGLLTFCVAVNFLSPSSSSDLHGSLFLLVHMGLIIIGSRLDRTTFHVFGTLGIIEYVIGVSTKRIETSKSVVLWLLKALVASSLFAMAIRRGGNIEIIAGIVCMLAFSFDYIIFITSSEFYSLLFLAANLGFVSIAGLFARQLDLWLFTLPDIQVIFSLISSMTVIMFHAKILARHLNSSPGKFGEHVFLLYRLLSSVALSFALVFLRQPHFAWVGGLGLPIIALSYSRGTDIHRKKTIYTFGGLLLGVSFSIFLQSNLLYLICCISLLFIEMSFMSKNKIQGCIYAVFLVLLSVPLNSKFLITIGALYIILYLTHLAYTTFKNSLIFPLVLILLGTVMIASAIGYQRYEQDIQTRFYALIPSTLKALFSRNIQSFWKEGTASDWVQFLSNSHFTLESFVNFPLNWVLWPGALSYSLVHGPVPYVTYVWALCMMIIVAACGIVEWRKTMMRHMDNQIKVDEIKLSLGKNPEYEGHGLVIKIKGTKPSSEQRPPYLALDVQDSSFWFAAGKEFGAFAVSMAKLMFLPYKLTPHLITTNGFEKGSTNFTATILLGTGHKGSQRMKHATVTSALTKLVRRAPHLPCVVVYSTSWYSPWSRLCLQDVNLSETLESDGFTQ